jgi:acetyl-CoA carboxylase biotin carboxyl carrier protein
MAENKKTQARDEPSGIMEFVRAQVDPISKAFAASPLAQLRVKTKLGSVTLQKASAPAAPGPADARQGDAAKAAGEHTKPATSRYAPLVPAQNGEAGRSYLTISSEVVGIFRDAASPPAPGERLRKDQVLGYIEALRLRNEVRCPGDATLVAQVVIDGQAVDFGEALFVVDTTETGAAAAPVEEAVAEPAAAAEPVIEPPRM